MVGVSCSINTWTVSKVFGGPLIASRLGFSTFLARIQTQASKLSGGSQYSKYSVNLAHKYTDTETTFISMKFCFKCIS